MFLWANEKNKKVFHFCRALQLKSSKCFRTCVDLASQHPLNSGSTHFSIMDGEVREATWHSQARAVWAPISSSGTVPTMLFFLLGCNVSTPASWIFSSSMSTWNSWIKHLKIITRPELHRLQHYVTFKCCQGVLQRKLICSPARPVCSRKIKQVHFGDYWARHTLPKF